MDQFSGMIRVAGIIDRSTYDVIRFAVKATDVNISSSQLPQTATGRLKGHSCTIYVYKFYRFPNEFRKSLYPDDNKVKINFIT